MNVWSWLCHSPLLLHRCRPWFLHRHWVQCSSAQRGSIRRVWSISQWRIHLSDKHRIWNKRDGYLCCCLITEIFVLCICQGLIYYFITIFISFKTCSRVSPDTRWETKDYLSWFPVIWREDSTSSRTIQQFDPYTDGATCCTTCLWTSPADISVDTEVNPLTPCSVQSQCRFFLLEDKNNNFIIFSQSSTPFLFNRKCWFKGYIVNIITAIDLNIWCTFLLL